MNYSFNLHLNLYNAKGQHIYKENVTGQALGTIKKTARLFGSAKSGGLTASADGTPLDNTNLQSLRKMKRGDFVTFIQQAEKQAQNIGYQTFAADC